MRVENTAGGAVLPELLCNWFDMLINRFFKILPIRECGESSLPVYIRSLQIELLGCKAFIPELCSDAGYLTLLGILQYLIDNPECAVHEVKREVFRAIGICNKLRDIYAEGGVWV